MEISAMEKCYEEIKRNSEIDEDTKELWEDILDKAIDYTGIRARWSLLSLEKKIETDGRRTSCHDSLIICFDIFSRWLDKINVAHSWRDIIGENRKDIGDFANYIVFREAISNR